MNVLKLIKNAKLIAIISFLLGTLILGIYYLTSNYLLLFVGYGFIIIAGIMNLFFLIALLLEINKHKIHRLKIFKTISIILLNIPIMILYCWIGIILTNTVRITFVNFTNKPLKNINIVGCQNKIIDEIEVGKSKNVWIEIPNDCGISIKYSINGDVKDETVSGYLTPGMGAKMEYIIGGTNKQILK